MYLLALCSMKFTSSVSIFTVACKLHLHISGDENGLLKNKYNHRQKKEKKGEQENEKNNDSTIHGFRCCGTRFWIC